MHTSRLNRDKQQVGIIDQAEDFAAKALQETKNYFTLGIIIALVSINIYAIVSNTAALNSIPSNPWLVYGNTYILEPSKTMCIGPIQQCLSQTSVAMLGTTQILSPIQIFTNWIIDQTAAGLRISYMNLSADPTEYLSAITPLVHFTNNGGVVIGPSPDNAVPGITTLMGTPVNYIINNTWLSTNSLAFSGTGTQYIDSVCHVLNASICGQLFRNSLSDIGIFRSIEHTIIGQVDYGAIVASLNAGVIVNKSIVIVDYTDVGTAIPCIQNPIGQPPESSNLWVDFYTGSCTIYSARNSSVVPINNCFALNTIPGLASFVNTNPAPFCTVIIEGNTLYLSFFSDPLCTQQPSSIPFTFSFGCTQATNSQSALYFRLQI